MRFLYFIVSLLCVVSTATAQSITSGSPVKVLDFGQLYSSYSWEADDKAALRAKLGDRAEVVILRSNEAAWPVGIATLDTRTQNRAKMAGYTLYYLTTVASNKAMLFVPVAENKHMPENMQPKNDIYFIINDKAIELKTVAAVPAEDFATQMDAITRDFENSFGNLINEDEMDITEDNIMLYGSLVMLEGAYQSLFFDDDESGNTIFRAAFPGDKDPAVALIAYQELVRKVSALTLSCCTLTKNDEQINGNSRSQAFEVNDTRGDYDSIYTDMVIEIGLEQAEGFDDQGNTVSVWEPVIYIYQL